MMQSTERVDLEPSLARPGYAEGLASPSILVLARRLTVVIALLMASASVLGLFAEGIYRDNEWARAGFRGNDLVSLFLATPLMLASVAAAHRGSARAHLIWLGTITYALYNYLFYLFGAAFNELFLVYVGLVGLSVWVLIPGLISTDADAICRLVSTTAPTKWVALNLLLIGVFLAVAWTAQSVRFIVDGTLPQVVIDSGIQTSVVFALDLSLLAPVLFVGAWLLWNRRPWGYVVAAVMMIKAAAYTIALISMSFFAAAANISGAWDLAPVWAVMSITSLASCWTLFSNLGGRFSET